MTQIILIRHGETAWNAERRLQGHLDIPLNAEGERQVAALGRVLAGEDIAAIYSSDLQRARQTAQAVAAPRGMTVQLDPELRERCYGALEGLLYAEMEQRYPQAFAMWRNRDLDGRFPAGERVAETLREFYQRAVGALGRLAQRHPERKIAVVTHGGVLECLYRAAHRIDLSQPRDFPIHNAGINRMSWDGSSWRVDAWSDTAHMDAALDELGK